MENKPTTDKIEVLLSEAKNIAIMPSLVAGNDALFASAALYYVLKNSDKNVNLIYQGDYPESAQGVIPQEELTHDVKQRSLIVSIDYSDTQASKVHYSTEDGVLSLRVSPISHDFNSDERVRSRIIGFDFDLIITLGAQSIEDLGNAYKSLDSESKISKILNIDNSNKNQRFGFVNVIEPDTKSLCMVLFNKLPFWGLELTEKAALALLNGITATQTPNKG